MCAWCRAGLGRRLRGEQGVGLGAGGGVPSKLIAEAYLDRHINVIYFVFQSLIVILNIGCMLVAIE